MHWGEDSGLNLEGRIPTVFRMGKERIFQFVILGLQLGDIHFLNYRIHFVVFLDLSFFFNSYFKELRELISIFTKSDMLFSLGYSLYFQCEFSGTDN